MRASEKHEHSKLTNKKVFGVNFHDFIEKHEHTPSLELASEFGLTLGEIRKLKKQLERS